MLCVHLHLQLFLDEQQIKHHCLVVLPHTKPQIIHSRLLPPFQILCIWGFFVLFFKSGAMYSTPHLAYTLISHPHISTKPCGCRDEDDRLESPEYLYQMGSHIFYCCQLYWHTFICKTFHNKIDGWLFTYIFYGTRPALIQLHSFMTFLFVVVFLCDLKKNKNVNRHSDFSVCRLTCLTLTLIKVRGEHAPVLSERKEISKVKLKGDPMCVVPLYQMP